MTSPGFFQRFLKMTIKQRIIIAVVLQATMICLIGLFVYLSFENVLSKLRSIEIIDDVNIALLEMRKAEKNYFLYKDLNALKELAKLGEEKHETIVSSKSWVGPILQEQGRKNYDRLLEIFKEYLALANNVISTRTPPQDFEAKIQDLRARVNLVIGTIAPTGTGQCQPHHK